MVWKAFHVVTGTPSDCVHVALTGLLGQRRPDLVISGINNGANMGDDTLYSAAPWPRPWKGFLFGVPAIAFSQAEKGWGELDAAAAHRPRGHRTGVGPGPARRQPFLLNVNIPNRADADLRPACRVSSPSLGRRHASEPVVRQTSPRGETIYWIGPAGDAREAGRRHRLPRRGATGEVSITPLQVDLTEHAATPRAGPKRWFVPLA